MRIVVVHESYGCETGCCGHAIEVDGNRHSFDLCGHPEGDYRQYAEDLVRDAFGEEHVADLDWENCLIVED